MINETDDSLRAQMKKRVPERAEEIEGMRFGAFTKRCFLLICWCLDCLGLGWLMLLCSYQQNVRDEMAILKSDPYLGKMGEACLWLAGHVFLLR